MMTLQRRLQLVGCNADDRWMAAALKVAFATSDMQRVDQHFGAARSFVIYAVDQERICFVEANEFCQPEMDGNEDKLVAKIAVLGGCSAVYCQAIGASAISQLKANGIHPVKVVPGTLIGETLVSLQDEMKQGPGGWLANAMRHSILADPSRFDEMEAEGWQE